MELWLVTVVSLSVVCIGRTESVLDSVESISDEVEQVAKQTTECALLSTSCADCVKNAKCLWCSSSAVQCIPYPVEEVIPSSDVCDLGDARWGVCWVNYKILLISVGCLAGVLVISIISCVCCCCCRCRAKSNTERIRLEIEVLERERQERSKSHEERRGERQARVDEIRRKYGLGKDSEPAYQRFENEA